MIDLLPDEQENVVFHISDLLHLTESGMPDAKERMIEVGHIEDLVQSNESLWPAIIVTHTSIGYVIVDGYHRIAALLRKGKETVLASVKAFSSTNEIMEFAFAENLRHGLTNNLSTRTAHALWLHRVYPQMEQIEIAKRCRISQPTVSKAIKREEEKRRTRPKQLVLHTEEEVWRKQVRNDFHKLLNDTMKFKKDLDQLPVPEQHDFVHESLSEDERTWLFSTFTMLEGLLSFDD